MPVCFLPSKYLEGKKNKISSKSLSPTPLIEVFFYYMKLCHLQEWGDSTIIKVLVKCEKLREITSLH